MWRGSARDWEGGRVWWRAGSQIFGESRKLWARTDGEEGGTKQEILEERAFAGAAVMLTLHYRF